MMAAICVAAFSLSTNDKKVIMEKWKKSDANCSMKVGNCGGKCLPKIQTMIDCKKDCKEPLFKKMDPHIYQNLTARASVSAG